MRALFVALSCAAALLVAPSDAQAQDRRPCVSKVEFYGVQPARGVTRSYVEHRWDVAGVGHRDKFLTDGHGIGYDYPVCGYSFSHAQVWVVYRRGTGFLVADFRWVAPGAPHRPNV